MKKISTQKIITIVLWIIGLSGLLASLAFASKKQKQVVAQNMSITITNNDENTFVDEDEVKLFFNERQDSILNTSIKNIDVTQLEQALNTHPAIENADVSVDVNGDVNVSVMQRTPMVRVINADGESYYIDSESKLMPLNDKYTARILIATGAIFEPYSQRYTTTVNDIAKHELYSKVSVLDDIYKVTQYINKDSVLISLIHQLNITKEKEIELFPSIGNHKIIFGDAENIEEKFNKLKLFYIEGMNKTDGWNKYSTVNIKYKNQVVCTKK